MSLSIGFFSTKRKRKKESKFKLKKPDKHDRDKAEHDLSEKEAAKCAICFCEDDNQNFPEVQWFECTSCKGWLHVACDAHLGKDDWCSLCKRMQNS